jgi:5-methylcytosine-specific restriction protein A
MKRTICRHPGCKSLVESPETYCQKHKKEKKPPFAGAVLFNDDLYKTSRWRTLRLKVLKESSFCFRFGIHESETRLEVHHIVPPRGNEELFFDESNLAVVCPACHRVITNIEIRKRKK